MLFSWKTAPDTCETPLRLMALCAATRGCSLAPKVTMQGMMSSHGVRAICDELERNGPREVTRAFVSLAKVTKCLQQSDGLKKCRPYWTKLVQTMRSDWRGVSELRDSRVSSSQLMPSNEELSGRLWEKASAPILCQWKPQTPTGSRRGNR